MNHQITIEIDDDRLSGYTDSYLALAWRVAQANPAPHGDKAAGDLVERLGREIIRRWLGQAPVELWNRKGETYYWNELRKFAKFVPGGPAGSPEWQQQGMWVARGDDKDQSAGEPR